MRRVVVTGASGGIGRAVVEAFVAAEWHVTAVDRVTAPGGLPTDDVLQLDLATPRAVETIVDYLDGHHLDALVNNAAVTADGSIAETDRATLDAVLATNLGAPFHLTARLREPLGRARGAIVNVASVHAIATSARVAAYATSKGGLAALTRAVAVELGPYGIRCNAVLPGATDTTMLDAGLRRLASDEADVDASRRQLAARTPLGRIGRPDEIAQAVLFLADGDRSAFVTGQLLAVDGGVLARLASE